MNRDVIHDRLHDNRLHALNLLCNRAGLGLRFGRLHSTAQCHYTVGNLDDESAALYRGICRQLCSDLVDN